MYWRRRLLVIGSIVLILVLLVLTIRAVAGGSGGTTAAKSSSPAGTPSTTPAGSTSSSSSPPPSSPSSSSGSGSRPSSSGSKSGSTSTAPPACTASDLSIKAVVGAPTYTVGANPLLELQVTNVSSTPCVQDLADKQVELRVYNGESRVWGSHDCQVEPGTDLRTLAVNTPVLVAITWSGLSSQPGCAGTRQRVGAGTYTLYALLAGQTGKAAQFVIN